VFSEKRLQTIENKGNECRKQGKESAKRLQADANKRVGRFERLKVARGERFGGTPRGNGTYAEAVERRRRADVRRTDESRAGAGATMGKGSAGVVGK
jgi:hypothetical protein